MRKTILFCSMCILLIRIASGQEEALDKSSYQKAKAIIANAEKSRGNEFSNFYYLMQIIDKIGDKIKSTSTIKVNVNQNEKIGKRNVLVNILDGKSTGNIILQRGSSMWFYKPGTANAIRISPIQRLSGGASYADVSSTNYSMDYDPVALKEVSLGAVTAYQVSLKAIQKGISYDKIEFYIEKTSQRPMKSEFYTRSGKLLKVMYFRDFGTLDTIKGIAREWLIVDTLYKGNTTSIILKKLIPETLAPQSYTKEGIIR